MRLQSNPRKGQRYRALRDVEIGSMVLFGAPYSDGSSGMLPEGAVVTIRDDAPEGATAVYAMPDRYEELEQVFVPERDRLNPRYSNYALFIYLRTLATEFQPVS